MKQPLSERVRPQNLQELIGQERLTSAQGMLHEALLSLRLPSMILWGPPGTGKTSLALLMAQELGAPLIQLSFLGAFTKELKEALAYADEQKRNHAPPPLVFIDEIHRLNKSQQDALLAHVESGAITLLAATTENPSFEVNSALLSRCQVLVLNALDVPAMMSILQRALTDQTRGLAEPAPEPQTIQALEAIAEQAYGDARKALNMLELAHQIAKRRQETLDLTHVTQAAQHSAVRYDAKGDQHYQVISAFIKSLRGSDPDAALYWLARMLEGGEDPLFICRRLVIFASEDIGNAEPSALAIAMHGTEATRFVGLPEAQLILAQTVTYLALAPKSNRSMLGLFAAQALVKKHGHLPVPMHLVNAPTAFMRDLGYGREYGYPHDEADAIGRQNYWPEKIGSARLYEPSERGREAELGRRLQGILAMRK